MSQSTVFELAVGNSLSRHEKSGALALDVTVVTGASLLLFLSSRMSVEIGPVPVTMQSIAAIMLALVLGPKRAAAAALLYFVECWAIPGFSTRPMTMTGGYVLGFVAAASIAGHLYQLGHGRTWLKAFFASSVANLAIFVVGIPWLAMTIGFSQAWEFGGKPFIAAELIKIACGVALLKSMSAVADRFESPQS
ncbi:MAG: biotin transport system substrate-specific component [Planctomycetota bacterium]|jgi:biotin transport system substrate-specific component